MDYFSLFIHMLQTKGLADNTICSYKTYIKPYLSYLHDRFILTDKASWQDMHDFLFWMKQQRCLSDRTLNMIITYLQFFHIFVLHKTWDRTQIPFCKFNVYLPFVPSRNEVHSFLHSLVDPKARLSVAILFATGLRLDELCHLRCQDIISSSKKIHILNSKNHQDRYIPMPDMIWHMIHGFSHSSIHWKIQWTNNYAIYLDMDDRLTAHSFRHTHVKTTLNF